MYIVSSATHIPLSFFILCVFIFFFFFFFFNDTATTEIYTLSLHDALPISNSFSDKSPISRASSTPSRKARAPRSEEHTSELQSQSNLVCRLLLEKKKKKKQSMMKTAQILQDNAIVHGCITITQVIREVVSI